MVGAAVVWECAVVAMAKMVCRRGGDVAPMCRRCRKRAVLTERTSHSTNFTCVVIGFLRHDAPLLLSEGQIGVSRRHTPDH